MNRNLLVTGGAGFIGSNFVHYWVQNYPEDNLIVLDALTYAGNLNNLKKLIEKNKISFIKGDISDKSTIYDTFVQNKINNVVHFAAESHVDRSIKSPDSFIQTNIIGTFNLIEVFRELKGKNVSENNWRFLHVSTDEVFGSLDLDEEPFSEETKYDPSSPYSASKAASDHLVRAWGKTFDLPILISNCSNNYGPYHYPEKLIPLTIINILLGKSIPIYGNGMNIRDWLYVEDHCRALGKILLEGKALDTYCIGGNNEITNIEIVNTICSLIDEIAPKYNIELPVIPSKKLIKFVEDRLGHDKRYAINSSKLNIELKWKPRVNFQEGIRKTIIWFLNNKDWWEDLKE